MRGVGCEERTVDADDLVSAWEPVSVLEGFVEGAEGESEAFLDGVAAVSDVDEAGSDVEEAAGVESTSMDSTAFS